MSRILIAVGGTGQEVALAVLRLSHLTGAEPPYVIVVDADQGGRATGGVRTRTQELQRLERFLKEQWGSGDLLAMVKPVSQNLRSRNVSDLKSLFGTAGAIPSKVEEALSLLFNATQQRTDLLDGFHGEPTVGAVAVADQGLHAETDTDADALELVAKRTQARAKHFVVIAGSTTGGTGPGAIPPLSERLLDWRSKLTPARDIEVSGVVQLQWFEPQEDDKVSWSRPPDIDLTRLQRNSACLVRQYHDQLKSMLDRLVLLGLPKIVKRVSAGPNHQPETLHWLNVLSGWIVLELMHDSQTLAILARGNIYGYSLGDNFSPLEQLHFQGNGRDVLLRDAVDASRIVGGFGGALREQLRGHKPDIAMPRNVYRLARHLHSKQREGQKALQHFVERFSELSDTDAEILEWLVEACTSRVCRGDLRSARDPNDVQGVFEVLRSRISTTIDAVAPLKGIRSRLTQDYVDALLRGVEIPALPTEPDAMALELYRQVRKIQLKAPTGSQRSVED